MPELDRYEQHGIDDEEQQEIDAAQRRALERRMEQEERLRQRGAHRVPDAF